MAPFWDHLFLDEFYATVGLDVPLALQQDLTRCGYQRTALVL
jgi:hypothetical protein